MMNFSVCNLWIVRKNRQTHGRQMSIYFRSPDSEKNEKCSIVMGVLTMLSIAVCLMFQRHNLYTVKLKSLAAIKSVPKTFPN